MKRKIRIKVNLIKSNQLIDILFRFVYFLSNILTLLIIIITFFFNKSQF